MGIGLSLCQQIIKKHGGNFYLQESQKGKRFCHRMAGNSLSTDFHNIIEYHFLRQ